MIWSPGASRDLEEICAFIARDSEKYARIVAQRLIDAVTSAAAHPDSGSIVPEYDRADLRERLVYSYRLVYRVYDRSIEVVTILHAARLLPGDLTEPDRS